jgi:hypothetical protein
MSKPKGNGLFLESFEKILVLGRSGGGAEGTVPDRCLVSSVTPDESAVRGREDAERRCSVRGLLEATADMLFSASKGVGDEFDDGSKLALFSGPVGLVF